MAMGNQEFQVIIFAGGKGNRLTQLLSGKPKCLLPIANKPMIQYPLELLIRSGIKETFILVLDNEEASIKSALHGLNLGITVTYVSIPSSHDAATVESLRLMKEKKLINKDLLILPCDLITDIKLTDFIVQYRLLDPTLLCLLSSYESVKENLVPAKKLIEDDEEYNIIGIDGDEANRLALFESILKYGDTMPMKKSFLELCPHLCLQTNLQDAHVYLLKNWILDYLTHKKNIHSIKADLVPSIVRKQFRLAPAISNDEKTLKSDEENAKPDAEKHIFDFIQTSELSEMLALLEVPPSEPRQYPDSLIKCYAQTVEPQSQTPGAPTSTANASYCLRVNNWLAYCEANRFLLTKHRSAGGRPVRDEKVQSHVDGLVGVNSTVGKGASIKRTVIGGNCKIEDKVKMVNCILQDNVTVGEGVCLENTIVCHDAVIGLGAKIKDCIVGPRQKVASHTYEANKSLTALAGEDLFEM